MVTGEKYFESEFTSLGEAAAQSVNISPHATLVNAVAIKSFLASTGLEKELVARGFRKFKLIGAGSMGIVVETTNHQVIRICRERTHADVAHFRARALQESQSIEMGERGRLLYEILPQYPQEHGDFSAQERLKNNLEAREYLRPEDHFKDNGRDTGYLSNGAAILLDPDSLDGTRSYAYDPVLDADWVVDAPDMKSKRFDLPEGKISLQEHDCPALMDGRVRGILSDDDRLRLMAGELEALRAEKPECFVGVTQAQLPEFVHYVFDEKMYPAEAIAQLEYTRGIKLVAPVLEGRILHKPSAPVQEKPAR